MYAHFRSFEKSYHFRTSSFWEDLIPDNCKTNLHNSPDLLDSCNTFQKMSIPQKMKPKKKSYCLFVNKLLTSWHLFNQIVTERGKYLKVLPKNTTTKKCSIASNPTKPFVFVASRSKKKLIPILASMYKQKKPGKSTDDNAFSL